jgi:hypothetical protein
MLEKGFREQDTVMAKFVMPVADYQMSVRDYVVRPLAGDATGPFTVTLPPVEQAAGRWYSIVAREADVNANVTVEDHMDDSECWEGDFVLDGQCDAVLCYSDGLKWTCITNLAKYQGSLSPSATPSSSASPSSSTSPSVSASVSPSVSASISASASPSVSPS